MTRIPCSCTVATDCPAHGAFARLAPAAAPRDASPATGVPGVMSMAELAASEAPTGALRDAEAPTPGEPRWRVGRKVGRTIYLDGHLFGIMDTATAATMAVDALNNAVEAETLRGQVRVAVQAGRHDVLRFLVEQRKLVPMAAFDKRRGDSVYNWHTDAIERVEHWLSCIEERDASLASTSTAPAGGTT